MPTENPNIVGASVTISPNNRHIAYITKSGNGFAVAIDGIEHGGFHSVDQALNFSPNSDRIAYIASEEERNEKSVVIDGKQQGKYNSVSNIVFSSNSESIAYRARRQNTALIVENEQEGEEYDDVGVPIFSSDSQHVAYYAKRGNKYLVILDGQEVGRHERLGDESPIFSPDSTQIAYGAFDDNNWEIVVGGGWQARNMMD